MIVTPPQISTLTSRPQGLLDNYSALLPYSGPWNTKLAAHLLRRAGFGSSPQDVTHLSSMNLAVDSLMNFSSINVNENIPSLEPPIVPPLGLYKDANVNMNGDNSSARKIFQEETAKIRRNNLLKLQVWWLERMISTPNPLQEKMTLFWHGHFTSSSEKQTTAQELLIQNQLFRQYALGNIKELTQKISQDPAMLRYLDNNVNVKAHPNENYARELMELFTLGIGNYTETDIRESARAFTGWSFKRNRDGTAEFFNNQRQHDNDNKTFLGHSGNFSGNDIVNIIFTQPACSQYFAKKLLSFFVYMDPEPQLIDQVATLLVKNNFELLPVLSIIFRSNVFYSSRAYRALVKSPVEFVVGTHRLFNINKINLPELIALRSMGQVLFYPPNVKGWDGGSTWLNSQTLLTRENFANGIARNPDISKNSPWFANAIFSYNPNTAAKILIDAMLQGDVSPAGLQKVSTYLNDGGETTLTQLSPENADQRVHNAAYLIMAMPAYQLT